MFSAEVSEAPKRWETMGEKCIDSRSSGPLTLRRYPNDALKRKPQLQKFGPSLFPESRTPQMLRGTESHLLRGTHPGTCNEDEEFHKITPCSRNDRRRGSLIPAPNSEGEVRVFRSVCEFDYGGKSIFSLVRDWFVPPPSFRAMIEAQDGYSENGKGLNQMSDQDLVL